VQASRLGAARALWDPDAAIDDMTWTELVVAAADLLRSVSGVATARPVLSPERLWRVRACIADSPGQRHPIAQFEHVAGLDH